MNRRAQLICIWCGPVLVILFAIGFVALGRFLPPWVGPDQDAAHVAQVFWDHAIRIRLGVLIMLISMGLMAPWGAAVAVQTRRREGRFPVLTYAQLTCVAIATAMILATCVFWGVAAFRPHAVSPEIVQLCDDVGWFFFLYTWPAFTLWAAAVGLAVLLDKADAPAYPRWAGYVSIWAAILIMPGGMITFFKTGPLAWNGLIALYVPVFAFFIWVVTMTVLTMMNIRGGIHDESVGTLAKSNEEGCAESWRVSPLGVRR
jgi:hypothetical protein